MVLSQGVDDVQMAGGFTTRSVVKSDAPALVYFFSLSPSK